MLLTLMMLPNPRLAIPARSPRPGSRRTARWPRTSRRFGREPAGHLAADTASGAGHQRDRPGEIGISAHDHSSSLIAAAGIAKALVDAACAQATDTPRPPTAATL